MDNKSEHFNYMIVTNDEGEAIYDEQGRILVQEEGNTIPGLYFYLMREFKFFFSQFSLPFQIRFFFRM